MPTPTIPSRTTSESSLFAGEMWRTSPLLVGSGNKSFTYLELASNRIIGQVNYKDQDSQLIAFNVITGEPDWTSRLDSYSGSIATDQDKVYVTVSGEPVRAFELENGNLAWTGPMLVARRSYFLNTQNDLLFNYFQGSIQTIDPQTGDLLDEEIKEVPTDPPYIVMRIGGFDLFEDAGILFKIKRDTGKVLWETAIDEDSGWARAFPSLSNDRLIMVFGQSDPDLYVFDFETGQRLWKADDTFVSNVAVSNGKIYILRDDARLLIYDEGSGNEQGYIQFTPANTDILSKKYGVGVDKEDRIFVYFSDSQELIGLTTK